MPRALGRLALADFLERVRRRSFLIAALAMVVVATLYLPARGAPYITMTIGPDTRGIYDSAWIGAVTACLSSLMFSSRRSTWSAGPSSATRRRASGRSSRPRR
jgi:hypothetical protein